MLVTLPFFVFSEGWIALVSLFSSAMAFACSMRMFLSPLVSQQCYTQKEKSYLKTKKVRYILLEFPVVATSRSFRKKNFCGQQMTTIAHFGQEVVFTSKNQEKKSKKCPIFDQKFRKKYFSKLIKNGFYLFSEAFGSVLVPI